MTTEHETVGDVLAEMHSMNASNPYAGACARRIERAHAADVAMREAIRKMAHALESGEWAEHALDSDDDVVRLETQITVLVGALHESSRALIESANARESAAQAGVPEGWRDVVRIAANRIAYVADSAFGLTLDDLDPHITESTAPAYEALIAERDLRAMLSAAPAPAAEPDPKPAPSDSTTRCTCPSGDGSLRWPCPSHPPSDAPASPQAAQGGDPVGDFLRHFETRGDHLFFSFGWEGVNLYNAAVKAHRLASAQPATAKPAGDAEFKVGDRVEWDSGCGKLAATIRGYSLDVDDSGFVDCVPASSLTRLTGGSHD